MRDANGAGRGDARPRVSVVMAVHNGGLYLQEAVESILNQTFSDFEFLIVDDGSTDRSPDVIRTYADRRIRLIENASNIGQTRSLNRGLTLARGDLIARHDADDVAEPDRFACQVEHLDANSDVALLGSQYVEIDHSGKAREGVRLPCSHVDICWHLLFNTAFVHSSVMMRRAPILEQVGLYNEDVIYAQDYEYWQRIANRFRVANLDAALVRYRVHERSLTAEFMGSEKNEMPQFRAQEHARLLNWDSGDSEAARSRSAAMAALLLGWGDTIETTRLQLAAKDILQLQLAFVRKQAVATGEARAHRSQVRSRLAAALALVAASHLARRPREAWQLFRCAMSVNWRSLLALRFLIKCGGRVAASRGLRVHLPSWRRPSFKREAGVGAPPNPGEDCSLKQGHGH